MVTNDNNLSPAQKSAKPPMLVKRNLSLKMRLTLLFCSLFLIMGLAVTTASIGALRREMINEMGQARLQILKQMGERMRIVVSSMQAVSNLYYNDYRIKEIVANRKVLTYSDITYLYSLDVNYSYAFKSIGIDYYAAIISKNGVGYYSQTTGANPKFFSMKDPRGTDWYDRVVDSDQEIVWISNFNLSSDEDSPRHTYSATRALFDSKTQAYNGMIMVSIDERQLHTMYADLLDMDNIIYAVDKDGLVITHPDQSMLGTQFVENHDWSATDSQKRFYIRNGKLITRYEASYAGWVLYEEIPLRQVFSSIYRVEASMLLIVGICILLSFVVISLFAKRTVRPLKVLSTNIERVGNGSLEPIVQEPGWSELHQIILVFNKMLAMLTNLMQDIKHHEREKRKSDMEYLRAQINPHFIYNTLFSVKCMVAMGKNEQSEYMLDEFIAYLKGTLSQNKEYATVESEMAELQRYLNILKMRYNNRFVASLRIHPNARGRLLPRMIVQPIVENAVFHGIEPKEEMSRLIVRARVTEDRLAITVFDTGVGIPADTIERIMTEKADARGAHIGIQNVNRRIQLYFGKEYGVCISSKAGRWTKVTITVPLLEQPE